MNSKTILIVDDDPAISLIFEFILQQAGYQTQTAFNGQDALRIVNSVAVDMVFLDLKMPGMSGLEVYNEIQTIKPGLLVIFMTGYSVDNFLKEAFNMGAYAIIYKPFDVEEVLAIIETAFSFSGTSI